MLRTDAIVGRTCVCKDYCENNGCTPNYQRGSCPPGTHPSAFVDGCGCHQCVPVDCSACTRSAGSLSECAVGDGAYYIEDCGCCVEPWTPIIIGLVDKPEVSDAAHGVQFDLSGTGQTRLIPWPVGPDDAWLVLDRNQNSLIDNGGELFGNFTVLASGERAANGFIALAELDTNRNGEIDEGDAGFQRLRLWRDTTRNGVVDPGELTSLKMAGIRTMSLDYRESRRRDRNGNVFKYRSKVEFRSGKLTWAFDVYLSQSAGRPTRP